MPALNIRDVTRGQMEVIKDAAKREGMQLREYVLAILLDGLTVVEPVADDLAAGAIAEPTTNAGRLEDEERMVLEPMAQDEERRPAHDPTTCQLYRCGMCAAIKAS